MGSQAAPEFSDPGRLHVCSLAFCLYGNPDVHDVRHDDCGAYVDASILSGRRPLDVFESERLEEILYE